MIVLLVSLTLLTWIVCAIVLMFLSFFTLPIFYRREAAAEVVATAIGITLSFWVLFPLLEVLL